MLNGDYRFHGTSMFADIQENQMRIQLPGRRLRSIDILLLKFLFSLVEAQPEPLTPICRLNSFDT